MTEDQNSSAKISPADMHGLLASMEANTPLGPATLSPLNQRASYRWVATHEDRFVLGGKPGYHMEKLPITNQEIWQGYIAQVRALDYRLRDEVLDYFNEISTEVEKSKRTAEYVMRLALDKVHNKYSAMRDGADEYDEVMQAQDLAEGEKP